MPAALSSSTAFITGLDSTPCTRTDATIVKATVDHSQSSPSSGGLAGGVREVVDRADPADAEERGRPALARCSPPTRRPVAPQAPVRPRPASGRTTRIRATPTGHATPVEAAQQAAGQGDPEHQQDEQREQPLEPLDHLVHRRVVVVVALGGPEAPSRRRRPRGTRSRRRPRPARTPRRAPRPRAGTRPRSATRSASVRDRKATRASPSPTASADERRRPRPCRRGTSPPTPPTSRTTAPSVASRIAANTNGNASPSLSPASEVRANRTSSASSTSWSPVCGPATCTSEASTGSVGASTAPSSSAAAGASPAHQPSSATARDAQRHRDGEQPPGRRPAAPASRGPGACSGRSRARPTPISATSTVSSVTCSMAARLACGSSGIGRAAG